MFACQNQIESGEFQQRTLQGFNSLFRNKVAAVRLACLPADKVDAYKIFMKEKNDANIAGMNRDN